MRYRRCSLCGEMRPLDRDNFRRKGAPSQGWEGTCTTCKPRTLQEIARGASERIKRRLK